MKQEQNTPVIKIAVLSDIHGNLPALEVVTADLEQWEPDLVVVNGDIVNRGPLSLECLSFVQKKQQEQNWQVLRGNHEDYVLDSGLPNSPRSGPQYDIIQSAHWVYKQLNGQVSVLNDLPNLFTFIAPDGSEFRATHASMRNNRDGIFQESPNEDITAQIAPAPAVFVTAHTHQAFVRQLDNTLLVNVGSVGAPFDLDPRAGYGRFTWSSVHGWQAQVVRLVYDRAHTEQGYADSGFLRDGGPLTQLMLVELRYARGLIYRWATRYQEAVLEGQMSMEASIYQVLQDEDLRPFVGTPGWAI